MMTGLAIIIVGVLALMVFSPPLVLQLSHLA
jgi:hypothetical protein